MKLIVGLGNPSREYDNTRHNIGFSCIDFYATTHDFVFSKTKFNGLYCEMLINNIKVIFLKPLSFMNLSGTVVRDFVNYYKIDLNDILIVQDDLDMPLGRIKIKINGSCGGHNGIRSIIDNLHSEAFMRVKVGISKSNLPSVADYVLGKFTREESSLLTKKRIVVNNIIDDFILETTPSIIMGKYNGVNNENI